ncbi:hypothetical protein GCM10010267_19100 [Streptomyces griseorubens]|nr:hypothetical protein GCM10010267_19100 [Streptomyces griseorubens]
MGPSAVPARPDAVAGDKAYSSRGNRAHLRKRRIKAIIQGKKNQVANRKKKGSQGGRPVSHDADLYKEQTEGMARHRHALRQDPPTATAPVCPHLRASMIWLRDLTRTIR